ncbi:MAG: pentapeptide repeat-containing protein [Armatimonadetes bacterium]|nr:pentapeptide repeat-containing protein [Armatimonadota bacterium]NOG39829.1 pentapeptide repeat-containing protein [Armatimonadota bacterium]GIK67607.1 MAG: hypothetical protein BroJett018_54010 [Chloroflexota bacterium]
MTQPSKDEIFELLRLHEEWANTLDKADRLGKPLAMDRLSMSGLDLSDRNLHGIILFASQFDRCNLQRTHLCYSHLGDVSFVGADFAGGCLVKAQVSDSNWAGCTLRGANLLRTVFFRVDMRRVDFSGADMSQTLLSEADLREANFSGANLEWISLSNQDLRGATGFETVRAEKILIQVDGKTTVLEGLDNIREWLFKASRL